MELEASWLGSEALCRKQQNPKITLETYMAICSAPTRGSFFDSRGVSVSVSVRGVRRLGVQHALPTASRFMWVLGI